MLFLFSLTPYTGKWYVSPMKKQQQEGGGGKGEGCKGGGEEASGYQLVEHGRPLVFCSRKTHAFYPNEGNYFFHYYC